MLGKLYYRLEMVDDALEILNSIDTTPLPPLNCSAYGESLHMKRKHVTEAIDEFKRACGIQKCCKCPVLLFSVWV